MMDKAIAERQRIRDWLLPHMTTKNRFVLNNKVSHHLFYMTSSYNIEGFYVMNAKIILGSSAFLFLGFAPISAVAQVTCTPIFGGGQRCTDSNGNSTTSTPTFGGGYRTTDNNGNTSTTTPTFGGGSRTTDDNGNTRMTTPTFGGGSRTTDSNGNTKTTTPTFGGGYRTTDQNGNVVTCVPIFGGGFRCQ